MTLKIDLDKELEKKFRELAMKRYGFTKGAIKKALESAIEKWTRETGLIEPTVKSDDPVMLMKGLLKEVKGKKTSTELKHEASKIWAEMVED